MGMDFVRDESLDVDDVRQIADSAGISGKACDVLVRVILEPDFLDSALGRERDRSNDLDWIQRFVKGSAECFRFQNPDASLLSLLAVLAGYQTSEWLPTLIPAYCLAEWNKTALGPFARPVWSDKLLTGIDSIGPAMLEIWTDTPSKKLIKFAGLLSDSVIVKKMAILDAINTETTRSSLKDTQSSELPSPATPMFWYLAFNQRGVFNLTGREPQADTLTRLLLQWADTQDNENMGIIYLSIIDALIVCTRKSPIQDSMSNVILAFLTGGNHLPMLSTRKIVLDHFSILTRRFQDSDKSSRAMLLAWLKTGAWVATRLPTSPLLASKNLTSEATLRIDDTSSHIEAAKTLLAHADRLVGHSRKAFREGQSVDWPALEYSIKILNWLGSPWRALRAVTQMMLLAPEPCTGPDLRWWNEEGLPNPPMPWALLAQWFSWLILWSDVHAEQDPDFKRGREDFSLFLLDRLKDREEDDKSPDQKGFRVPVESRPEWRIAICEAAIALHANPKGRGDHILFQVMMNDPDEKVRASAVKAYKKVRNYKGDTGGMVARNLFMKAFWWLRQAQRLSLGLEIDSVGARRTASKELDRNAVNQWV